MNTYIGTSSSNISEPAAYAFILIVGAVIITLVIIRGNCLYKVQCNSTRLRILNSINGQYSFNTDICSLTYNVTTETKRQFDRFDFDGHMQSLIRENMDYFTNQINKCEYNRDKYTEYMNMVQLITTDSIKSDAMRCELSTNLFTKIENNLMKKSIKNASTSFGATCWLSYTSPKGRSSYRCHHDYSYEEIKTAYKNANRRNITKESIAYERAMVTDSLRYDIFKRDGFRCQICGRSQKDGVVLRLDHIVPVSKGGKTVPSNLRTLCDRCNIGKSDKYDPNGLN